MFMLAISTLVNYIVLVAVYFVSYVLLLGHKNIVTELLWICLAIELILLIMGMSKYGFWILRFYQNYRYPVQRELDRFKPLVEMVIAKHNSV